MCFEDQAILPINRGHNTHKEGGNFETKKKKSHKNPKDKTLEPSLPKRVVAPHSSWFSSSLLFLGSLSWPTTTAVSIFPPSATRQPLVKKQVDLPTSLLFCSWSSN